MRKLFNKSHLKNASADGHDRADASPRSISPFITVPPMSAPATASPLHVQQHMQASQPKSPPLSAAQPNDQSEPTEYQQGLSATQIQQLRERRERRDLHRELMTRDSVGLASSEDVWEVVRSPSPATVLDYPQQQQSQQMLTAQTQLQSQMPVGHPQQGQQRRQGIERKDSRSSLATLPGLHLAPPIVPSSRSSSLKALPPGALPPVAAPHVQQGAYNMPSSAPSSSPVLAQHSAQHVSSTLRKKETLVIHTKDRDKERAKDREKDRDHSRGTAAILRALDSSIIGHSIHSNSQQQQRAHSDSTHTSIQAIPHSPKESNQQLQVPRTQESQHSQRAQDHASRVSISEIEFNAADSDTDSFDIDPDRVSADTTKVRRRREFDWWQRDREINVNAVGRDNKEKSKLRGKEKEREKDKDRDRESKGFFDRLQAQLEDDSRKRRDGSQELERESKDGREEKEKKYQWTTIFSAVRDRGQEKEKEKVRAKEATEARGVPSDPLARMVGLFVTLSHDRIDWMLALDICERASLNDVDAKVMARALRKELKYARPVEQLGAATLWAIMLLNASDYFITQTSSRKFLEVVEDLIINSRFETLRGRLIEVLGAAVCVSADKGGRDGLKREGFRSLWRKVKPDGYPEDGIPLTTDHPMFRAKVGFPPPGTPRSIQSMDAKFANLHVRERSVSQNGIIPVDEDMRRLFQECKVGHANAEMLSEALTFATPDDLKRKDIIKEFYAKCRASQDFLQSQISWADVNAERSRRRQAELNDSRTGDLPREMRPTREEELLAELLGANENLTEALRIYDEIEKIGVEQEVERQLASKNRVDLRGNGMDHHQASGDTSSLFLNPPSTATLSSRSPSPASMQQHGLQPSQVPMYGPRDHKPVHKEQNESLLLAPSPTFSNQGQGGMMPLSNSSHGHLTVGNGNLPTQARGALHGPRSPQPTRGTDAPLSRSPSPGRVSRPDSRTHSRPASQPTSLDLHRNNAYLQVQMQPQPQPQPQAQALPYVPIQAPTLGKTHSGSRSVGEPAPMRDSTLFHGGMGVSDPEVESTCMSEKAAGKCRMAECEVENTETTHEDANSDDFIPPELLEPSGYDADDANEDKSTWADKWKCDVHYVYDAAAERTQARIREALLRNALAA